MGQVGVSASHFGQIGWAYCRPARPGDGHLFGVGGGRPFSPKETLRMKKTFIAIAAAASLGLAPVPAPPAAEARCWRLGCALAVGIGVATGVAVGTAIARSTYPEYAPAAGYVAYPAYAGPMPVGCPGGY